MSEDKFGITLVDRDRVWAEVQNALARQKNEDILTVMFDDDSDAPSIAKIQKILDILKRHDEVIHDWDLILHAGKTAKQEAEERDERMRKAFSSGMRNYDYPFGDIFSSI